MTALQEAGAAVERLTDHFLKGTPDEVWLAEAGVALQPSRAACAAATAAWMSFSPPAGTMFITSPVPALCTSIISLEEGATHWPSMKDLSRGIMERS